MRRVTPVLLALVACGSPEGPPSSPAEALETFHLHEDFQIELVASEPDIADPVAMDFDADGRLYVAENSGYPLDVDGARGRIKLISEGKTSLFADGLRMPTGVMAWKNGVIVTDAPEVLYLEDSDGDGISDIRKVLLSGFAFTNPQHTVSSPVYGLDNWIYLSHEGYTRAAVFSEEFGDVGTEIHFPDLPDGPSVPVSRRSVRFRPDTGELELLAAPSQFGQTFSEWGDLFVHNNSYHARHEVVAARYLARNPDLQVERLTQDVYDQPMPAAVYPITKNPRFEILSGAGQMTSACGLTRYLGGAFPGYEDLAFVAEPVHNIVHADRWRYSGSTFTGKALESGREFLASTDAWFRPVNFAHGPDGALYLVDYYRDVIEHPEWTSAETYESATLYDGSDRGRIWRITPAASLPAAGKLPGAMTPAELVAELSSPNLWRRRTAQRLLVERQSTEALDAINQLAADDDQPLGRLHALWTLSGLSRLEDDQIIAALASASPGLRRNALVLAEPRLREAPALWAPRLLPLAQDEDPQVRMQWMLTAGYSSSPQDLGARERLITASLNDEWMQTAALTWPNADALGLLTRLAPRLDPGDASERFIRKIAASAPASGVLTWLQSESVAWKRAAALQGLERPAVADRRALFSLALDDDPAVRSAALDNLEELGWGPGGEALRSASERFLADPSATPERRADAVRTLALIDPAGYADQFQALIAVEQPEPVQAAAVAAYALSDSDEVGTLLLDRWMELPPAARSRAAQAMVQTDARAQGLVGALEQGRIQPWMLAFAQRRKLIMYSDPSLRERARKALTSEDRDRRSVLAQYEAELAAAPGEASKGKVVFQRVCAECHAFNGRGQDVGPDLATVRTRPARNILYDILLPNASIAQTYESYVVEKTDGEILDGVIGPQGPGFVTLRREGGEQLRIPTSEIRSMRSSSLSGMPGDLENLVKPREMADLIRYIQAGG